MSTTDTEHSKASPYRSSAVLRDIPPFGPEISFRFDRRVNVLIGPNGVGKSTALSTFANIPHSRFSPGFEDAEGQSTVLMEHGENQEDVTNVYVGPTRIPLDPDTVMAELQQFEAQEKLIRRLNIARRTAFAGSSVGFIFVVAIMVGLFFPVQMPWLQKVGPTGMQILAVCVCVSNIVYLVAAWARRNPLKFVPVDRLLSNMLTQQSSVSSIFMFLTVQIVNRSWSATGRSPRKDRRSTAAVEAAELALSCAKRIAPEVFPQTASLHDGMFMVSDAGSRKLWRDLSWGKFYEIPFSSVNTRYVTYPLPISSLSSGTQGPLLIAWYLALRLAYAHGFRPGWDERPAVLFIDEIENHLHPIWQRRFIPAFLEHFPNLQIFATTHSPFAVAGLKAGQVHKLFRNEDGGIEVETNHYELVGWTADEILHEYLDVDDPTDLETAEAVEVLRWLEELDDLTNEETAESWRTETLDDLNGLVQQNEATPEETIVARWLGGKIDAPVPLTLPLTGAAQTWKTAIVNDFRSVAGVDILSGGPVARQRELRNQQIADGTLRVP